ncbi:MAG TPA: hypothetical protein VMX16_10570 [Terriglobia bacterium]|nr:hypothetical protein [Terriglobia bacterium]
MTVRNAQAEDPSEAIPTFTSWKRILGGAVFGLLSSAYIGNAAGETVPLILHMTEGLGVDAARFRYESSLWFRGTELVATVFFGAAAAGFLGRRKGVLSGFISGSPYIFVCAYLLLPHSVGSHVHTLGDLGDSGQLQPYQRLYLTVMLILLSAAAIVGGWTGERFYSPKRDRDLESGKITVFGVRWPHYLWIIPLIYRFFFASVILIVYAGISSYLADLSYLLHPSLWLSLSWCLASSAAPFLIWLSGMVTIAGFARFYEVMQYRQTRWRGWGRAGRVILFGVGAPTLSFAIAAVGVSIVHAMPKPVPGDWKLAVIIAAVVLLIWSASSVHAWLKNT